MNKLTAAVSTTKPCFTSMFGTQSFVVDYSTSGFASIGQYQKN